MEILDTTDLSRIDNLASRHKFEDWDVILAGDGSGSGWSLGCAWACVLIDRENGRQKFRGFWNWGTVMIAELMPYIEALTWYEEECGRRDGDRAALVNVDIVSDSKALVDIGISLTEGGRPVSTVSNNPSLWAALMSFETRGFVLRFHHINRVTWALNAYVDDAARITYEAQKTIPWPSTPSGKELSIYECNADHDRPTQAHEFAPKPAAKKGRKARAPIEDDDE